MTSSLLISLTMTAAAFVSLPGPPTTARLGRLKSAEAWSVPPLWRRALMTVAAVLAIGALLNLWPWWVGTLLAGAAGASTFRLPARTSSADRTEDRRRLAIHADLLAACLDSGMSVGAALLAVPSESARGSPGARRDDVDPLKLLDGVAAMLMLGADPESAWRSARAHPDLASLAAAARRSAAGGAGFADAVREHALDLRAAIADAAQRSAGRAGVAMTAPLGLCFLPGFLCLGLAPVVVGLLSTLNLF